MILRKPVEVEFESTGKGVQADPWTPARGWEARAPLRWRLSLLTGVVCAGAVGLMTLVTYGLVGSLMTADIDSELESQSTALLEYTLAADPTEDIADQISTFKGFHPNTRVSISPSEWTYSYGDSIPVGGELNPTETQSQTQTSVRTIGQERVITKQHSSGAVVVLARDLAHTRELISTTGTVLVVIASLGILMALLAGMWVSKTGLGPITRLQRAADYVTQTNDLRPILVVGSDEIAQLTISFNEMLSVLQEARIQQSQFVADAGHELKTPLTSMRTNIELLLMVNKPGAATTISEQDRKELEEDVLAQMTELSTLIGDLVDLAREDASEKKAEVVELHEVMETSLERARRRRPDVEFKVRIEPWIVQGDQFALGRATLNLMDNAAKWSPPSGVVRVTMHQISDYEMRLRVDDSGPGIPPEERDKVFERFYRSAEARSMPGSGLGLAIVRQVIERHEGRIMVKESPDGGTRMEVILPGQPGSGRSYEDAGLEGEDSGSERREIFAQRWFNQT
ncbi:HAMP domain-containing histidine kinase [Corynebacterium lizhenjunii]|uniref:histidine kinase n=1 Tax=Corynebacterium lizhenjunii TaxID=2709394 RepID=A0A7T0KG54_9CORY|nr:HAMP domain-containing sensor histidine kinase [Corynebacterium lizhenjunii]QPK79796.1 HAMP domain-containing histidine kinase [Corynebacterium lizhenjunii]